MAKIDDSVKKKVPELRFKGFTDDWEERKLGEVGKTKSGIGFPDAQQGGKQVTPFYKVSDMNNPGNEVVMMNANNYASDSQLKENKWNPINPQNSGVVFAKVGAAIFLDRKRIVDTSFLIDNNMMSYLFDSSWNRYFGKTLFEKLRLSIFAQVGALPSFNGSDVEDIKVMIPEESEQKMIGDMFEKLDDIIALHQRKLDLLKEQKKGYLQKMFPKNGAKVPELRFEGFADDWEERKLSSGLREYTDRVIVEDDKEYYQISVRNNFGGITLRGSKMGNKIGRKRQAKINLTKYPQTLIFTRQTVEQGGIGWVDKYCDGAIVTENMPTISLDTSVFSKYFLTNLFQTRIFYKNAILDNIEGGSAQIAIHESKFLSSTLLFPNLDEQQKIGQFFKQLDDTIDLHQRKLDLLKEQKKGFLQKMFV